MKVYEAISAVMSDMSLEGISKNRKNQQQNYNFRGIDDVYNALSSVLSKHKLCVLPRMIARDTVERQTKSGGVLFYVTVEAEFDLVSSEDGSKHTIRTFGEAMDSGDKATNKAMSAAYKYAAMQAFCIPTEGDNDADSTTHEVVPDTAKPLSKAKGRDLYGEMQAELDACQTLEELGILWGSKAFQDEFKKLPADWKEHLVERKDQCKADLTKGGGYVPPKFDE